MADMPDLFAAYIWKKRLLEGVSTFLTFRLAAIAGILNDYEFTSYDIEHNVQLFEGLGRTTLLHLVNQDLELSEFPPEANFEVLGRQMLVVARSYLDGIVQDFLISLFVHNPNKMRQLLRQAERDKINLSDLLDAQSKDELIRSLASVAAETVTSSKNVQIMMNKVAGVTGISIPPPVITNLEHMRLRRNDLVHQVRTSHSDINSITKDEVLTAFQALAELLDLLLTAARNNNVPYVDTSLDITLEKNFHLSARGVHPTDLFDRAP